MELPRPCACSRPRVGTALNAAPFFYKTDANIPPDEKVPELHRYVAGGTLGGPLIKNKLFGFIAYQHLQVSDQEIGDDFLTVPVGLADTNRDANGFAGVVNNSFCSADDIAAGYCAAPFTGGWTYR